MWSAHGLECVIKVVGYDSPCSVVASGGAFGNSLAWLGVVVVAGAGWIEAAEGELEGAGGEAVAVGGAADGVVIEGAAVVDVAELATRDEGAFSAWEEDGVGLGEGEGDKIGKGEEVEH